MFTETTDNDTEADDGSLESETRAVAESATAEHAARLLRAFELWQFTKTKKQEESKRLNDLVGGRRAQFAEAMAVGHSKPSDQILKLSVVEQRWQELEESIAEKKDVMGAYRDQTKAAEAKIKDLMAEAKSGQMSMFGEEPAGDATE